MEPSTQATADVAAREYTGPTGLTVLGVGAGACVWGVAVLLAVIYANTLLTPVGLVAAFVGVALCRFAFRRSWGLSLAASGTVALLAPLLLFFSIVTVV